MFNPTSYITIWEDHPTLSSVFYNVYKLVSFFTVVFLILSINDINNNYNYWTIVALSTLVIYGIFIRQVIRDDNTTRHIFTFAFHSLLFKIWSIVGIIWFNSDIKDVFNIHLRGLILYNIFSYFDLLFLFTSCFLFQLTYSGCIKSKPGLETKGLLNSEIIDYYPDLEGTICTICLDEYKEIDIIRKTNCNHIYHDKCILPWFKISATCPTCRYTFN